MKLGVNLSFAVKRLPEAREWARFVRESLGLDLVQFTFDLLDPWTPKTHRRALAAQARRAAQDYGITIHSAFVGLAAYSYNGLLHPEQAGRQAARAWWERAIELTADLGSTGLGGQLGGLSVADAARPHVARERLEQAFQAWSELSRIAADAGLETLYIEPTPLTREFPHTLEMSRQMASDWAGRTAIPVKYAVDVGHAIYRPLYGDNLAASLESWLVELADDIGLLHLQNTDGHSDSHWGWPDPRGTFDVARFGAVVKQAGLEDRPIFIEVFYPFELADEAVLDNIKSTVAHCKAALGLSR